MSLTLKNLDLGSSLSVPQTGCPVNLTILAGAEVGPSANDIGTVSTGQVRTGLACQLQIQWAALEEGKQRVLGSVSGARQRKHCKGQGEAVWRSWGQGDQGSYGTQILPARGEGHGKESEPPLPRRETVQMWVLC